jgi:hypothetical protein
VKYAQLLNDASEIKRIVNDPAPDRAETPRWVAVGADD